MPTYYVSVSGIDSADRDGLSWETAWSTLDYASRHVPEGSHTIQLGEGLFVETQTAWLRSGMTIAGINRNGENKTQIIASRDWPKSESAHRGNFPVEEYLISAQNIEDVTIRDISLASYPEHRIAGALFAKQVKHLDIFNVEVNDFRWAGFNIERAAGLSIHNNNLTNASLEKHNVFGGLIRTRWIKHSEIYNNAFRSTIKGGYGYEGAGHENVRLHHNVFDIKGGFSIEIAHENEFGVEIDNNIINRTISVPKSGQGQNPNNRGYEYSIWIHHNYLADSYTIEGPRNHLRISHNYANLQRTGGRFYTHHGGRNNGPIWIERNVVENVDRALVWMNRGLAENIFVYNNTVCLADAGNRASAVLGAPNENRLNNWVFKNNIVIAPENQPRRLFNRGISNKVIATDNVVVNLIDPPPDNHINVNPGLAFTGERPWPFYIASSSKSYVIDRGINVNLPYSGEAPDIGAYEFTDSNVIENRDATIGLGQLEDDLLIGNNILANECVIPDLMSRDLAGSLNTFLNSLGGVPQISSTHIMLLSGFVLLLTYLLLAWARNLLQLNKKY